MSPTEADLRAALRDGEGAGDGVPDVDGLIAHVRARRTQRRVRALSAAGAVIVVAAAAVGGAVLWGGSDSTGPTHGRRDALAPTTARAGDAVPATVHPSCPATANRLIDPPGQVPSTAPDTAMFAAPVQTLVVCSYTDAAAAQQVTLTGSAAAALAAGIEAASPTRVAILCPDITTGRTALLTLIPVTADGTVLPTVTTDISIPDCNRPITNGVAVRYNWRPPQSLTAQLDAQH